MSSRRLLTVLLPLALAGCGGEGSPLIGSTYEVGCGNAAAAEIEDQVFDLRPHNSCGMGLISYVKTVTSLSEEVEADLRIECGVGFCIGSVQILGWSD